MADRCIRGKVVDYIQFNMDKSDRMERMTYNIADFSIFIGTVLYMINSGSKKSKKNNKNNKLRASGQLSARKLFL